MDSLARNLIQRVNVGDSLTRSAWTRPDHPAIVDGTRRISYGQLNAWVNRLAHGLLSLGFRPGEALGLASGNSAEFLAIYYACAKIGVVCVPINLAWRADEVAYVLGHSRARALFVEAQLVGVTCPALESCPAVVDVVVLPGLGGTYDKQPVDRNWQTLADLESTDDSEPAVEVDDRAALTYLYTSGTTSFPKVSSRAIRRCICAR